jgi:hypothetical protein
VLPGKQNKGIYKCLSSFGPKLKLSKAATHLTTTNQAVITFPIATSPLRRSSLAASVVLEQLPYSLIEHGKWQHSKWVGRRTKWIAIIHHSILDTLKSIHAVAVQMMKENMERI